MVTLLTIIGIICTSHSPVLSLTAKRNKVLLLATSFMVKIWGKFIQVIRIVLATHSVHCLNPFFEPVRG